VQLTIADHGSTGRSTRWSPAIGDFDAYKEYQRAVFERTEAYMLMDPRFTRS